MNDEITTEPALAAKTGPVRLAIGFAQGLAAWLLLELVWSGFSEFTGPRKAELEMYWSARHPIAFAALTLVTAFIPVIALAEIGRMPWRRLGLYLAATTGALILLTVYDITRDPIENGGLIPRIWPSATLIFCGGIMLFIVNQLLEFRETGARFYTHYSLHFEESWMRAFQFMLSLVFVGLVWAVLLLGAALFDLIHISALSTLLEKNWFRCPVLGMAFAASVHITDVRPPLLRGMRNLGLTLLGWLLPLVTVLAAAFLLALLVVGVEPLWSTRRAASLLLTAASVILVLLNAAYKDGDPAHAPPAVLRWAGRLAGPVMLALALLASWAILLRIGQYGWTAQRVQSAATAAIALLYGAGYAWASADRTTWLKRLERVNVTASFAMLAVLGALLTPLADPDRIAVTSQVARLHAGKVTPEKFDYALLRFQTGRVGTEALAALAKDSNPEIAARAKRAQASKDRYNYGGEPDPAITEVPFSHAAIYPKGAALPQDFRVKDWQETASFDAPCMENGTPCDIFVLPGKPAPTLVIHRTNAPSGEDSAPVYTRDASGDWHRTGTLNNLRCPAVIAALREGKAAPVRPPYDDLMAAGIRLEMTPERGFGPDPCPEPQPKPQPAPTPKPSDANAPARMGPAFGNPGPG
ncbi:DUF4153 domain-containing protein [Novosphingobium sp. PASSN1]|uniref:DUF4153 domain-containing protein n=1 Tax=Novosphingobium sp. PASSN1 TaxID=2015561 RepID=UPI000BD79FA3|nr:DUF4153 domain-containing protein [Novosphingobium sp. PASSN1]OYU33406.1 MAG: hypothetical protein CFE35_20350 [Novosphingobium sp. PASSN1]